MRIVHYAPTIYLAEGGVARAVLDYCAIFAERGHHLTLITFQGSEIPADWFGGGAGLPHAITIPVPIFPGRRLGRQAIRLASDAIRQADVVHVHGPWLPGNRQIVDLARRYNVPSIVTLHGMLDDWIMRQRPYKKRLYMSLLGTPLLNRVSTIHSTAEAELQQASKWFTNPNTVVLPCLIDLQPFVEMPGAEMAMSLLPAACRAKKKILFLSRLHEKKGVDIAIRAAKILRDDGIDFVLLIAGTGDAAYVLQLKELTTQLDLNEHVVFLGIVTGPTKISVYQSADVFVLPTMQENFGLVLAEALASGVPVVTTKGTDIWNEIQQAGGLIVENTPAGFATALKRLLSDPDEREALGRKGRQWTFDTFAVAPLAAKYEALYRTSARPSQK